MFESLVSLAGVAVPPSVPSNPIERRNQRIEVAQRVIQSIAAKSQIGNAKPISVSIVDEKEVLLTNDSNSKTRCVGVSPYFLIEENEWEQLGSRANDPKEVATFVRKQLGFSEKNITATEIRHAQRFIQWREKCDPADRTAQIKFIFAHELGHIHHQHAGVKFALGSAILSALPFWVSVPVLLGLLVAFIGLAVASPALLPVFAIPILVVLLVTLGIDIPLASIIVKQINHYKELQADAFAAKTVGVEGGIASQKFSQEVSKNKNFHSHPAPSKRIEQLERIKKEQSPEIEWPA